MDEGAEGLMCGRPPIGKCVLELFDRLVGGAHVSGLLVRPKRRWL